MSPWCAVAVDTRTGRDAASPLAFASEEPPRRSQIATTARITTAAISQIHQRLLRVLAFSWVELPVACGADFLESIKSGCCSVTYTPQITLLRSQISDR